MFRTLLAVLPPFTPCPHCCFFLSCTNKFHLTWFDFLLLAAASRGVCSTSRIMTQKDTKGGSQPVQFIVHLAPPHSSASRNEIFLHLCIVSIAIYFSLEHAGLTILLDSISSPRLAVSLLAVSAYVIARPGRKPKSTTASVVQILPLGLQMCTIVEQGRYGKNDSSNNRHQQTIVGSPHFVPEEDIIDVIVSEVVLAWKVESKIMLRVRSNGVTTDEGVVTTANLPQSARIRLVEAFPHAQLSYEQCLDLCEGIMKELGKL